MSMYGRKYFNHQPTRRTGLAKALDYVDDSRTSILYQSGNDSAGHYIHFVEKTIF